VSRPGQPLILGAAKPGYLDSLVPILAAAWSVNDKLLSTYSGPLLRVRRASDSTEADIGSIGGRCDRAALAAFCSATSGTIAIGYDQTANARNIAQGTTANQPQIFGSGVPVTQGGNVAMQFDGVDDHLIRLDSCGISGNVDVTLVALYQSSNTADQLVMALGPLTSSTLALRQVASLPAAATSGQIVRYGTAQTGYHYDILQHAVGTDLISSTMRTNGATAAYVSGTTAAVSVTNSQTTIGVGNGAAVLQFAGKMSTLLVLNGRPNAAQLATLEAWLEARRVA
jgi:hypothetical protein